MHSSCGFFAFPFAALRSRVVRADNRVASPETAPEQTQQGKYCEFTIFGNSYSALRLSYAQGIRKSWRDYSVLSSPTLNAEFCTAMS